MLTLYTTVNCEMSFPCAKCCSIIDTLYHELQLGKDVMLSADHLRYLSLHALLLSISLHIMEPCWDTSFQALQELLHGLACTEQ